MKTYVESTPRELQDAAEIDGAGTMRIFISVTDHNALHKEPLEEGIYQQDRRYHNNSHRHPDAGGCLGRSKKTVALGLAAVMALSVTGCGGKETEGQGSGESSTGGGDLHLLQDIQKVIQILNLRCSQLLIVIPGQAH